jgi:hypothetical protein
MSREKERQKQRLINLANFIEKNPHLYNHNNPSQCIVGLGNRLVRGKLQPPTFGWMHERARDFVKRYGVSCSIVYDLFWGKFNKINRNQKNWTLGQYEKIPVKSAVTVLRHLTK